LALFVRDKPLTELGSLSSSVKREQLKKLKNGADLLHPGKDWGLCADFTFRYRYFLYSPYILSVHIPGLHMSDKRCLFCN
uniref:hypothetical protein n=1 Tax=Faecalibaculum rodentium TaxID=1702221 RepID=UPI0025AC6751